MKINDEALHPTVSIYGSVALLQSLSGNTSVCRIL
jgi:hypothetical protein